jgi:hypothetical protein
LVSLSLHLLVVSADTKEGGFVLQSRSLSVLHRRCRWFALVGASTSLPPGPRLQFAHVPSFLPKSIAITFVAMHHLPNSLASLFPLMLHRIIAAISAHPYANRRHIRCSQAVVTSQAG